MALPDLFGDVVFGFLLFFIDFAARKLAASAARGIAADFTYNTRKV